MPYTLWSRGRLLGESDLGFVQVFSNLRTGWFHPSPQGEALMSVLTGPGPALKKIGKLLRDPVQKAIRPPVEDDQEFPRDIRATSEYADLVSSVDELESMNLELRDPNGVVMTVEHLGIDDMEFKMSFIPKKLRLEREAAPEPWEPPSEPFPRYQLQVHFPGPRTVIPDMLPR